MRRTREQILDERRQLKKEYGEDLFNSIAAVLFRADPIGINFDVNPDEYHAETGTILPRLRTCNSSEDVERVIYQEFVRWFGAYDVGPQDRYKAIALEIWQLWQSRRKY